MLKPTEVLVNKSLFLLIFNVLAVILLLVNLDIFEYKNEESLRTIVAYEMQQTGQWFQPTYLGDLYYQKPPLFTWLVLASQYFVGWTELAVRLVSVSSTLIICCTIYFTSLRLLNDKKLSLFASLIFATCVHIQFFYGFIGEIDVTFSAFVFLQTSCLLLAYHENKKILLILGGLFAAASFMLKGLPGYVFFAITCMVLTFWYKKWRWLFSISFILACLCSVLPVIAWLSETTNPEQAITTLLFESTSRTKASADIGKLLFHLIVFPLELFKNLLPSSLLTFIPLLFLLLKKPKSFLTNTQFTPSREFQLLIVLTATNFLPYLISAGARARYVMPIYPLMAMIFAYIIHHYTTDKYRSIFLNVLAIVICARLLYALFGFELIMEHKPRSIKRNYELAVNMIDVNKQIACDCKPNKAICLYFNQENNLYLKKSIYTPNWEYIIDCRPKLRSDASLIHSFPDYGINLYKRSSGSESN